jgi:glyoxylase-like metal-dependent hydrolase (beta-lactamase superfamily II)
LAAPRPLVNILKRAKLSFPSEDFLKNHKESGEDLSMNILNRTRNLVLASAIVFVQQQPAPPAPPPMIKEGATVKISEHVYVIPDGSVQAVPNVGIVVGNRATLVIDTGLGARNGQAVVREMGKVSRNSEVYLVATHFHSEHALGETGFPATAKVIRARAQQRDMDASGVAPNFSTRSPVHAELMKDAQYRRADELFDNEKVLDLGGVRARLLWYGGTHTNGDTMIFVEGDNVLFSGDVVMSRRFLAFNSAASSIRAWLSSLDKLESLKPSRVVPSHGDMGDGSLIGVNRDYLRALQTRVQQLKREGKTADQAVETAGAEFRTKYTGWTGNPAGAARSAYNEAP